MQKITGHICGQQAKHVGSKTCINLKTKTPNGLTPEFTTLSSKSGSVAYWPNGKTMCYNLTNSTILLVAMLDFSGRWYSKEIIMQAMRLYGSVADSANRRDFTQKHLFRA